MSRFSLPVLFAKAVCGNKTWDPQWPAAEPKAEYDVVIVGAGGHGLASAYYPATEHGVTNVAVIDKGWLGGGNTGRNTTIGRGREGQTIHVPMPDRTHAAVVGGTSFFDPENKRLAV